MPYVEINAYYENTIMHEITDDEGTLTGYDIAPIDGYVIHNVAFDVYDNNEDGTEERKIISHGYSPSSCSVEPTYNFAANPDEIYAVKKEDVDEQYIY